MKTKSMRIPILFIAIILIFSLPLAGCKSKVASTASATPLPAVTDQSNTSPTPDTQSSQPQPLQYGERIIGNVSINDVVKKFGNYSSYTTSYSPGTVETEIKLIYPHMNIIFASSGDDPLSFQGNGDDGYTDSTLNKLTDHDKQIKLYLVYICWDNPNVSGPRGVKIGDTLAEVKAKFMNRSSSYSDGKTIYTIADAYPDFPGYTGIGGQYTALDNTSNTLGTLDMKADHMLYYQAYQPVKGSDGSMGLNGYEYTSFFFSNGHLAAIAQGQQPNEP